MTGQRSNIPFTTVILSYLWAFVKTRTGPDGGLDQTGPDQTKYTGEHKLLSAREVTIVTCVQAIQIQQAATVTSMEQAVEIQQSTTVTSMEQVIEIVSDDGDFWEQH